MFFLKKFFGKIHRIWDKSEDKRPCGCRYPNVCEECRPAVRTERKHEPDFWADCAEGRCPHVTLMSLNDPNASWNLPK